MHLPNEPSPLVATSDGAAAFLEVRGLRRSFGKFAAVDGVDLTVRCGEIYGFLGVNGAGKTTTIRLLMGILSADAGTFKLLGRPIRRVSIQEKRRIGYVSQEQHFYPWMTCADLGRFVGACYPTWDGAEFARLLRIFDIPERRRCSELSGGMTAKLALALAVAPHPDLLVLDEPTAGLDPLARREFMELVTQQARQRGCTTLFSSHLIDEVERCADRVGIIHQGRMRFEGAMAELRDRVRQYLVPVGADLPQNNDLAIWNDATIDEMRRVTLHSRSGAWSDDTLPPGSTRVPLSLEDIFVAFVRAPAASS
ncbi:MAG: ABC transporter ATP-binding protein [bacterium]|nr:ABC transporter ATP-binding protein [bacterium]